MTWLRDELARALLDEHGGPFGTSAFRQAVVDSLPGLHDLSFGASLPDGTKAAVPLVGSSRTADSVPPSGYGGIVASRPLEPAEQVALFTAAFRELRLRRLEVRSLALDDACACGDVLALASVVPSGERPPAEGYSRLTRRSLAKAGRAGCSVATGASADDFWPVYAAASKDWALRYPERLVRTLVEREIARVDVVRLDGRVVAALLSLVRGSHWMCWLAGQTSEGRRVAASYLAYDALLADAHTAGVPAVNLGASVGSGAEFKQHLGAEQRPMRIFRLEARSAATARRARLGVAALRRAVRRS